MVLGPKDPSFFSHLTVTACGHLACGRSGQSLDSALRSIALNAQCDSSYVALIAAYMSPNRPAKAKTAAGKLLTLHPKALATTYDRILPMRAA